MSDLRQALGLTTRTVSTVDLDGRPARRQQLTRSYRTGVHDLWHALTDPERIARWFLPVTGELREGGTYQLEGNAGGTVERCDPPRSFRVSWGMGEGEPAVLTVTLTPEPDAAGPGSVTWLDLDFVAHVPQEWWEQYGPGSTGIGWDLAAYGLEQHLATAAAVDREQAEAWMLSPEGLAFIQASNDAWQAASVADGTPPPEAAAAAARTYAFYTGGSEPPQA